MVAAAAAGAEITTNSASVDMSTAITFPLATLEVPDNAEDLAASAAANVATPAAEGRA
jgi:hypothetical protein